MCTSGEYLLSTAICKNIFIRMKCFRFLRVVQTLQSLSRKTGRLLWDALPREEGPSRDLGRMQSLWNSLESTLTQLRVAFLQSESNSSREDGEDRHGLDQKKGKGNDGDRKTPAKEAADKEREVSLLDAFSAHVSLSRYIFPLIFLDDEQGRRRKQWPAADCASLCVEPPTTGY